MEISKKHWTVRLIEFSLGDDALNDVYNTCDYRKKIGFAILLLPIAIALSPFTLILKLIIKGWLHCLGTFMALFIIGVFALGIYVLIAMWFDPVLFIPGWFLLGMLILISGFITFQYLFVDQENRTVRELINSWKEKYCKPIDFK